MLRLIFLSLFLATCHVYGDGDGDGEDLTVLPIDVAKDKQVICDAFNAKNGAELKVDVSDIMDYDDLLRLTVWNAKYNLKQDHFSLSMPDLEWKLKILHQLRYVFTAACPTEIVPHGFINAAQDLFMIYQNSLNATENHSEAWSNGFFSILKDCEGPKEKFEITTSGFMATHVKVPTKTGETENIEILPPMELVDNSQDIDIIIDTIWWLFSFTFGKCYWTAPNPSIWASRYKRFFYAVFLKDLKTRWLHAGLRTDFGLIFGEFNLPVVMHNLRACVSAAYIKNGLADRQLVRSISLAPSNLGVDAGINKKVTDLTA